jgi:Flp pilus assembly protein TadD
LKNAAADRSPFTAQSYSEMRTAYAVALAERGRTEEARAELEEALRLNPGNTQAARNLEILGRGGGAAAKER